MGEIADALKKSKSDKGRKSQDGPGPAAPAQPEETDPGSYHDAMKLADRSSGRIGIDEETDLELQPANFSARHIDIEGHRHLAVEVRSRLEKVAARSLAIVSPLRNEGKTTVACNLAAALASLTGDREVALVDLDLRNPTVRRWLGVRPTIGLESFLLGQVGIEETCIHLEDPSLDVYPAVVAQRSAHEAPQGLATGDLGFLKAPVAIRDDRGIEIVDPAATDRPLERRVGVAPLATRLTAQQSLRRR